MSFGLDVWEKMDARSVCANGLNFEVFEQGKETELLFAFMVFPSMRFHGDTRSRFSLSSGIGCGSPT